MERETVSKRAKIVRPSDDADLLLMEGTFGMRTTRASKDDKIRLLAVITLIADRERRGFTAILRNAGASSSASRQSAFVTTAVLLQRGYEAAVQRSEPYTEDQWQQAEEKLIEGMVEDKKAVEDARKQLRADADLLLQHEVYQAWRAAYAHATETVERQFSALAQDDPIDDRALASAPDVDMDTKRDDTKAQLASATQSKERLQRFFDARKTAADLPSAIDAVGPQALVFPPQDRFGAGLSLKRIWENHMTTEVDLIVRFSEETKSTMELVREEGMAIAGLGSRDWKSFQHRAHRQAVKAVDEERLMLSPDAEKLMETPAFRVLEREIEQHFQRAIDAETPQWSPAIVMSLICQYYDHVADDVVVHPDYGHIYFGGSGNVGSMPWVRLDWPSQQIIHGFIVGKTATALAAYRTEREAFVQRSLPFLKRHLAANFYRIADLTCRVFNRFLVDRMIDRTEPETPTQMQSANAAFLSHVPPEEAGLHGLARLCVFLACGSESGQRLPWSNSANVAAVVARIAFGASRGTTATIASHTETCPGRVKSEDDLKRYAEWHRCQFEALHTGSGCPLRHDPQSLGFSTADRKQVRDLRARFFSSVIQCLVINATDRLRIPIRPRRCAIFEGAWPPEGCQPVLRAFRLWHRTNPYSERLFYQSRATPLLAQVESGGTCLFLLGFDLYRALSAKDMSDMSPRIFTDLFYPCVKLTFAQELGISIPMGRITQWRAHPLKSGDLDPHAHLARFVFHGLELEWAKGPMPIEIIEDFKERSESRHEALQYRVDRTLASTAIESHVRGVVRYFGLVSNQFITPAPLKEEWTHFIEWGSHALGQAMMQDMNFCDKSIRSKQPKHISHREYFRLHYLSLGLAQLLTIGLQTVSDDLRLQLLACQRTVTTPKEPRQPLCDLLPCKHQVTGFVVGYEHVSVPFLLEPLLGYRLPEVANHLMTCDQAVLSVHSLLSLARSMALHPDAMMRVCYLRLFRPAHIDDCKGPLANRLFRVFNTGRFQRRSHALEPRPRRGSVARALRTVLCDIVELHLLPPLLANPSVSSHLSTFIDFPQNLTFTRNFRFRMRGNNSLIEPDSVSLPVLYALSCLPHIVRMTLSVLNSTRSDVGDTLRLLDDLSFPRASECPVYG